MISDAVRLCRLPWVRGLVLVSMTLIVYLPCLRGEFLWDDNGWVPRMSRVMGTTKGLWQMWTKLGVLEQYYPVTGTSFWLDYQLWYPDPLPFHLENVLLHAASALLFWRLLAQLQVSGAWFAAALLAVHPVMVESVAWITERKNVLSLLGLLTAFHAMLRYQHGFSLSDSPRPRRWWWIAFAAFVFALLSKVTAYVFAPALLVLAWWKRGRVDWRRDVIPLIPMLVLSVCVGLLTGWMEVHHIGAKGADFHLGLPERVVLAGQLCWWYLGKLLWPHPLCVLYEKWTLDASLWWQWLGVVAAASVGIAVWRRAPRGFVAATFIFVGCLFPVLGFLNVYGMKLAWAADRWAYLAALPVFAVVGDWVTRWPSAPLRRGVQGLALITCAILTWRQAGLYRTADRFWQAAIAGSARPFVAHNSYSEPLIEQGRFEEALKHLHAALELAPDCAEAWSNLGIVQQNLRRYDEALAAFQRGLAQQPDNQVICRNLARLHAELGQLEDAESNLREALRLRPDYASARNELANLLFRMNRLDDAEREFQELLTRHPERTEVYASLGNVRLRQQRTAEAVELFERALADDPDLIPALVNAAWIRATSADEKLRDGPRAEALALRAVKLTHRQNAAALRVLAAAHAEQDRFVEAADAALEGMRFAGEDEGMRQSLSQIFEISMARRKYRQ